MVNLPLALEKTEFAWLGNCYQGKVRDCYSVGEKQILIATDRLSAFDRILTTVPCKGQVLTRLAQFWFERTESIIPNHVLAVPDPNVMVVRNVDILPIEVVVRGYLAGSAWRDYVSGKKVSGISLPPGLKEFDKLPEPILTPSTKAALGNHDLPISEEEILSKGVASRDVWHVVRTKALQLFSFGSKEVESRGLILADTKYEFGLIGDKVLLADEIHTLDSSRFWISESLRERAGRGQPPVMLDKEPVRRWLMERGFSGEGAPPMIPDEYRAQLMKHYIDSATMITGETFLTDLTPPIERIEKVLRSNFA